MGCGLVWCEWVAIHSPFYPAMLKNFVTLDSWLVPRPLLRAYFIPETPHRVDEGRAVKWLVNFIPQIAHVYLYGIGQYVGIKIPYMVDNV
jgi:hypothetical protein